MSLHMSLRSFPGSASALEWLWNAADDYRAITAIAWTGLSSRVKARREEMAWRKLHRKFHRNFPVAKLSLQEIIDLDFRTTEEMARRKRTQLAVSKLITKTTN